jgi:hypothetical protein
MPSNQQLTSPGSITAPRTPRDRLSGRPSQYLNIQDATSRPISANYLIQSPVLPPGEKRQENWSKEIEKEWDARVNNNSTRFILTAEKRSDYQWHLSNPQAPLRGNTKAERANDGNIRVTARKGFEIQDNQIYRKSEYDKRGQKQRDSRYAVCYSDSFEILCSGHKGLLHAYKCLSPSLFLY